tara:strand:- start:254 stop:550 length:297 start_codon:yes stop_codon:yes gene_type:complete
VFKIFKVQGTSMLPTIKHNDYLLTLKINKIKKNNVVVASSGDKKFIVKRIKDISDKFITFSSDNKKTESEFCDKKFPLNTNVNRAFLIYRYPFNFEIL